jgi:cytochrome b561
MNDTPGSAAAPQGHHSPLTIALHWATLAGLLMAVAAVLLREVLDSDNLRTQLLALHRQAALTVLVLLVLRLAARLGSGLRAAPAVAALPAWQRHAASLSHLALYAGLLAVPLLGSALSDARGQHTAWLGWLPLPRLAATDPGLADTLEDLHQWAAWALGALVLLHAGAALWHHWVRRDGVLRAMWPRAPGPATQAGTEPDLSSARQQP